MLLTYKLRQRIASDNPLASSAANDSIIGSSARVTGLPITRCVLVAATAEDGVITGAGRPLPPSPAESPGRYLEKTQCNACGKAALFMGTA